MDLVGWSEAAFLRIHDELSVLLGKLEFHRVELVPCSALHGDNIAARSTRMPWHGGRSLFEVLEALEAEDDLQSSAPRFVVQLVRRAAAGEDRARRYAGFVASGRLREGDAITVFPSGIGTRIARIERFEGAQDEAVAGESVSIVLEDELDVDRGSILAGAQSPRVEQSFDALLCWMADAASSPDTRYELLHTASSGPCLLQQVHHLIDIHTLSPGGSARALAPNDVARVRIRSARPLVHDLYADNRVTGSILLVDRSTGSTAAAGLIVA
jgi:sulfate adenylyltransferase subunit 1 (EFTu-like GTPase family)